MELLPTNDRRAIELMNQKRIYEFEADDFRNLHIVFLKWAKFLGIKEAPDEEHIVMLILFVKEHYNNFSIAMIKEAFNLAIARRLPNVDPEHYQNFSPVYVGGILKAYYDYTERARKAYIAATQKVELKQNEITPEQAELGMYNLIKECIENPKRIGLSGEVVYDYLVKTGYINYTDDEKKEILEQAKKQAKSEIIGAKSGALSVESLIKSIDAHPRKKNSSVVSMCKKIGLSVYLNKLEENGRNELLVKLAESQNERLEAVRKR
jgi:hypothetical protein